MSIPPNQFRRDHSNDKFFAGKSLQLEALQLELENHYNWKQNHIGSIPFRPQQKMS